MRAAVSHEHRLTRMYPTKEYWSGTAPPRCRVPTRRARFREGLAELAEAGIWGSAATNPSRALGDPCCNQVGRHTRREANPGCRESVFLEFERRSLAGHILCTV